MNETRGQLVAVLINHGMSRLSGVEYQPGFQTAEGNFEIAHLQVGNFNVIHTRPEDGRSFELFDISQGRKVFAARKEGPNADWQLVNIKRGDWESAFLLT